MEQIHSSRVIGYQDELLVELLGSDEHGEVDAVTYQFDYGDADRTVNPKEPIDDAHRAAVETVLEQEGYQLASVLS